MLRVGITGGIGSGKSTVCSFFKLLGIPVYEADIRAKWIIENDKDVKLKISLLFGSEAYLGIKYNRNFIAEQIFKNKDLLLKLNSIVHPAVKNDWEQWVLKQSNTPYVIKEAAIMGEATPQSQINKIIVVNTSEKLRVERVKLRDPNRSEAQILEIIKNQKSELEFKAIADFVLQNDEHTMLIPQILALHKKLILTS